LVERLELLVNLDFRVREGRLDRPDGQGCKELVVRRELMDKWVQLGHLE